MLGRRRSSVKDIAAMFSVNEEAKLSYIEKQAVHDCIICAQSRSRVDMIQLCRNSAHPRVCIDCATKELHYQLMHIHSRKWPMRCMFDQSKAIPSVKLLELAIRSRAGGYADPITEEDMAKYEGFCKEILHPECETNDISGDDPETVKLVTPVIIYGDAPGVGTITVLIALLHGMAQSHVIATYIVTEHALVPFARDALLEIVASSARTDAMDVQLANPMISSG